MRSSPTVTAVRFLPARPLDQQTGLLGWARVTFDSEIEVDGVAVRRTLAGGLRLSLPRRRDGQGRHHCIVSLTSAAARHSVETQVLRELHRQGVLS